MMMTDVGRSEYPATPEPRQAPDVLFLRYLLGNAAAGSRRASRLHRTTRRAKYLMRVIDMLGPVLSESADGDVV